ncbi:hypothetical protein XCR_2585 [Xanthomonas campestris pv. raphani 756C]|nr:hypothetical protein XCR_2585 [Xanthomonas campestris pv. raphani 756C]
MAAVHELDDRSDPAARFRCCGCRESDAIVSTLVDYRLPRF